MYEATGALTTVLPSSLFVLVALPLLWTLAVLTAGSRPTLVKRIALAGSAGTLGWSVLVAYRMGQAHGHGPRHVLGEHIGSLVRVGTLDLGFDLQCDALAATGILVVGSVTFASIVRAIWAERVHRGMAFVGLLSAGANLVVLAEGFAPLAVGLGLTTVSAFVVARGANVTAMVTALAADACAVFALFFMYWALGGSFSATSGYESEPLARFVLVASPSPPLGPKSVLAMSSSPGAAVTVDDGPPPPGEPLRSPFVVEVTPSAYTFRIATSPGGPEVVVPHVVLAPGRSYTLAPFGPTASFRSLADQLEVKRPLANGAVVDARMLLATRSIAGFRATFVVAVLLGVALGARLLVAASRKRALPLALALEAAIPALVALRLAPLFDPVAVDGAAFAAIGGAVAFVCGGRAAAARDPFTVIRAVAAATASLVLVAAGLADVAGGLVVFVTAVLSSAAALAAIEARRDVRWLGIACAAAVGLLPVAGISSGVASVTARAVDPASSWRATGVGLAVAIVVVVALSAAAAFRMYDAIISEPRHDLGSRATSTLALVLASIALASGVVLGAGTAAFGGRLVPLSGRMLDVAAPRGDAWTGLALAVVAPAVGLFLARRPWARPEAFSVAERPARLLRRVASGVARFARFVGDGATTLDREVISDVADVAGNAVVGLARIVVRADDAVRVRALGAPLGRVSDAAATRLGLDHPRVLSRLAAVAVFVMVALLALVVLSSVLLG